MSLVPFKFVVHSVFLDLDEDGKPKGESVAEPVILYGVDALQAWAATITDQLAGLQPEQNE